MKQVKVKYGNTDYEFQIREEPYSSLDDLWVENRKHAYLRFVGANVNDDQLIQKARQLSTFELIVKGGLKVSSDQTEFAKIQAVGLVPPEIVNQVVDEFFDQFEAVSEDPKK